MLTLTRAYNYSNFYDYQKYLRTGNLPNFDKIEDEFFKNLVKRMMTLNYGERIETSELLTYLMEKKTNTDIVPVENKHRLNIKDLLKDHIEVFFT
jgi:hypothetical protein